MAYEHGRAKRAVLAALEREDWVGLPVRMRADRTIDA